MCGLGRRGSKMGFGIFMLRLPIYFFILFLVLKFDPVFLSNGAKFNLYPCSWLTNSIFIFICIFVSLTSWVNKLMEHSF